MPKNAFSCDCHVVHEDAVHVVSAKMLSDTDFSQLATFFKVLGDPTRIRILWALQQHELCVCDIANILCMTKSAVSHQLSTLRHAKLVTYRRDGKTVYYTLSKADASESAQIGVLSALYGPSSCAGDSLANSSAPKITRNSARFRSQNL